MLSDPQTITVAGVGKTLNRLPQSGNNTIYQNSDESYRLTITHRKDSKFITSTVRFENLAMVDTGSPAGNTLESNGNTLTFRRPVKGFSETQVKDHTAGFIAWLAANSHAIVAAIYQQQA